MLSETAHYSPDVSIYIQFGEEKIQVADVLVSTATLCAPAQIPVGASAFLVFQIGGQEYRDLVLFPDGASGDSNLVSFTYPANDLDSSGFVA